MFLELGASTGEAQQRVAVEIAEQFLALSGKFANYAVTGVVNAPIMAAAMSRENAVWIELSRKIGSLAGKLSKQDQGSQPIIESQTHGGPSMENKSFVHTAVLVGLVDGLTADNHNNLISAPATAEKIGIKVNKSHIHGDNNAIVVTAGQHRLKGDFSKIFFLCIHLYL